VSPVVVPYSIPTARVVDSDTTGMEKVAASCARPRAIRNRCDLRAALRNATCAEPCGMRDEPLRFVASSAYAPAVSAVTAIANADAAPWRANRNAMFWLVHSLCWLTYGVTQY